MTGKLSIKQKLLICFGWLILVFYTYTAIGVTFKLNEQYNYLKEAQVKAETTPKLASSEEYLELVNAERAKVGVRPLVIDPDLNNTARLKVKDMIALNYYEHDRPDGTKKWIDFLIENYREGATVSENQAECYHDKYQTTEGWKHSPSHLAGLTDDRMTYFGSYSQINPKDGCMVVVNHFSS